MGVVDYCSHRAGMTPRSRMKAFDTNLSGHYHVKKSDFRHHHHLAFLTCIRESAVQQQGSISMQATYQADCNSLSSTAGFLPGESVGQRLLLNDSALLLRSARTRRCPLRLTAVDDLQNLISCNHLWQTRSGSQSSKHKTCLWSLQPETIISTMLPKLDD